MTTVLPFDPAESIADGRTIIEASAGTGKTFTIAATVARLIAVDGLALDRILVVTFTRAATAELKGRVRERLVATQAVVESRRSPGNDNHFAFLAGLDPEPKGTAASRLAAALADFDQAQIFTIHGFAQRLLGQLGLRVRLPETLEPGEIDDLVLAQVASDVVVGRFASNPGGEAVVTPGEAARLASRVLAHPDATLLPEPDDVEGVARARVELARAVAEETRARMRASGTMSYDDGLIEVRDALDDPAVGPSAASLLQERYDVGLIDESQDTDPIQWQIIRRIFDPSRLVVIGDPKQSIYSFRGADIEAYLSAVEGASSHRTLTTNWRSDGPLVKALDVLFTGATFGDERIEYRRVEAAPAHRGSRIHGVGAPLHLRLVDSGLPIPCRRDGFFRLPSCRETLAADAASHVVDLLAGGATIDREDGNSRPLGPSDIAVLCRTRSQVELVRTELRRRGVPSVAARTGGVLVTEAAEQWRRFLLAVERPDRLDLVRLAATTLLIGRPLDVVAALGDEEALELQRQMREWNQTLQEGGVPALVAALDQRTGLAARLLALPDGERLMTDIIHIAEEMHAVFRRGRHGSLVAWLETSMQEAARRERKSIEEPESRQRRLETDAAAVTVQTVHGAKGLQYPVVLVPFAWDASVRDQDFPVFHDPAPLSPGATRQRLLDVSGGISPDFEDHRALARAEEQAEESRLLYVALTRAQHHLVVWWVENHARIDEAKLTALITRDGHTPATLAARAGGTISVSTLSEMPRLRRFQPPDTAPSPLAIADWARDTDQSWRRVSFSSLASDQPLAVAEEKAEHPLRTDEPEVPEDEEPMTVATEHLILGDLPAGARFGTLVHDVLEDVRFDDDQLQTRVAELAVVEMRAAGWDFDPAVLARGLAAALDTPLGPETDAPTLASLEQTGLARELAFEFPIRTEQEPITLGDIGAVMDAHLPGGDPYRPYVAELLSLSSQPFRGYLAGAIDLIGVLPDGRYVVMDYKSNSLLPAGSVATPADYGPAALAAEMVSHRYVLQATLYQVALHRYLQWRLPGYDPAGHLGGSIYLFLRGMVGPQTPVIDGHRCGVTGWRPPPEMVLALSRLMAGETP